MTWSTKMPKKPGGRWLVTVDGTVRQAELYEGYGGVLLWLLLQRHRMATTTGPFPQQEPMNPAAQAILDAFHRELSPYNKPGGLVAAFRAAADILNEAYVNEEYIEPADVFLYDIASELEAYQ